MAILQKMNWIWSPIRLTLTDDFIWDSDDKDKNFLNYWLTITNGVWHIKKGFAWNGTTAVPDGKALKDIIGVPVASSTGKIPRTWQASLIHDIACIYIYEESFPYTRKESDEIFLKMLKKIKFKSSKLYFFGVRLFSKFIVAPIFFLFGWRI